MKTIPFGTPIPFGMILLVISCNRESCNRESCNSRLHDSRESCNREVLNYRQRISRIEIVDNAFYQVSTTHFTYFHVRLCKDGLNLDADFTCFRMSCHDNALTFATRIHFCVCVCVSGATRGHTGGHVCRVAVMSHDTFPTWVY